jgi:hypothetical protein
MLAEPCAAVGGAHSPPRLILVRSALSDTWGMDDENRLTILHLKSQLWDKPQYRDTITSQNIYEAVLDGGGDTLDGFFKHLEKKRQG